MQHQDCAALEAPVQQAGIAALLGAAPQGAGAQQRHSLVTASLLPQPKELCHRQPTYAVSSNHAGALDYQKTSWCLYRFV